MRLVRVPLVMVEDHLINLDYLVNAYVEDESGYGTKPWTLRYFTDPDSTGEGATILFRSKKAAMEALATIASCTDTLVVDEEG